MSEIDDQDVLRRTWAGVADLQHEPRLLLDLLEGMPDEPGIAAHRARALLMLGRPTEALAALPDVSRDAVVSGHVHGWGDLVAAACWAATGDERALGAVMRQGVGLAGGDAHTHALLLATAADQAGRREIADPAWLGLVQSAPVTEHVLVRAAAAMVVARDARDSSRAAADVLAVADLLLAWHGADPYGIHRVRAVVDLLATRGDRAGAALLLHALVRMRPGHEGFASLARDHRVDRRRWLEHGVRALGIAAGAALVGLGVAGPVPGAVAFLGVAAVVVAATHRLRTARGLGKVDDAAVRAVGYTGLDVPASMPWLARAPWWLTLLMTAPLSVLLGFVAVYALAVPLVPAEVELGDDPWVDGFVASGTALAALGVLTLLLRFRRPTSPGRRSGGEPPSTRPGAARSATAGAGPTRRSRRRSPVSTSHGT